MQTISAWHSTALGACAALFLLIPAAPAWAGLETLAAPEPLPVVEEWAPTLLGEGIGRSGLNVADLDGSGTLKIVTGAAQGSFMSNRYWYVLSPSGGGYEQEWVSPLYTADITALRTEDMDGVPGAEIVVAAGKEILLYDGATRELLRTVRTRTPRIEGLTVADADGDGELEFAFCGSELFGRPGLHVYDAASGEEEYYAREYPCWDVAVGNVDEDPAPEIVLGAVPGYVLDGATREPEWAYEPGFGRMVELADVDEDGLEEIVVGGTWGTGHITIFDADTRSMAWEIPVFGVDAMLVAKLGRLGGPEIVFGEEQWGSVHVWDTRTRRHKWSVKNPEHGVAELAAGDTDGDGVNELLWGAGYSTTGADLLVVTGTDTGRIEWQSAGTRGPFGALDAGDVDLDGEPELLYGSDVLFVHDARTKALESEIGAPEPASSWIMQRARLANVDGDPQPEIVTAGYSNFQGLVVCRDGITHEEQWRWTGSVADSLEVVDVDADGQLEVVAGLGNYLVSLDAATGVEEWRSSQFWPVTEQLTMLRIADVDDDPHPEILAVLYGHLFIFDGVTRTQQPGAFELDITALDVFDRDGDGTAEILVGTATGRVGFVDPSAGAITETLGRYGEKINAVAAVDLTGDFVPELVLALREEVVIYDGRFPSERLWRSGLIGSGVGGDDGLLVADLDEDGRIEILVSLGLIGVRVFEVGARESELPPGPFLESPELPGFRFKVRITAGGQEFAGTMEADCLAETLCVSGALPGRSELFLRLIGPRPNGYLWVNVVRFTPSRVEVWVERTATGQVNCYELPPLPAQNTQLAGLVDRRAFWTGGDAAGAAGDTPRRRPLGAPGVSPLLAQALAPAAVGGGAGAAKATSEALPGFEVSVRILANGVEQPARIEDDCLADTVCVSGALAGRSELFLRVIGPRPNGFLWVNLVRFTTSRVEVEIEQLETGETKTYVLPQVPNGSDELPGRLDREAFAP